MANAYKVPLEDRQNAWKYHHGEVTLAKAVDLCEHLIDPKYKPENVTHYPLIMSLYGLYGRPFNQREPYRLSIDMVPAEMQDDHRNIMKLRNKVFTHIDRGNDALKSDDDDYLVDMIVLNDGKSILAAMDSLVPMENAIKNMHIIACEVQKKCQTEMAKVWGKFSGGLEHLPHGKYLINITDPGEATLIKYSKQRQNNTINEIRALVDQWLIQRYHWARTRYRERYTHKLGVCMSSLDARAVRGDRSEILLEDLGTEFALSGLTAQPPEIIRSRDVHGFFELEARPDLVLHVQLYPGMSTNDELQVFARVMEKERMLSLRRSVSPGNEHEAVTHMLANFSLANVRVPWGKERLAQALEQDVRDSVGV